jgi:hypothetical protein
LKTLANQKKRILTGQKLLTHHLILGGSGHQFIQITASIKTLHISNYLGLIEVFNSKSLIVTLKNQKMSGRTGGPSSPAKNSKARRKGLFLF